MGDDEDEIDSLSIWNKLEIRNGDTLYFDGQRVLTESDAGRLAALEQRKLTALGDLLARLTPGARRQEP